MKRFLKVSKILISLILCCTLIMGSVSTLVASAAQKKLEFTRFYDLDEVSKLYLSQNEETVKEYPNGAFMIPVSSAQMLMNDTYALEIFREGGVKGDASITLKTIDYTAGYGEDYEILVALNDKPIEGKANRYYDIEGYSFIATKTETETVYASNQDEDISFVRDTASQHNDEVLEVMPVSSEFTLDFKDGENSKTIYIKTYQKKEITDDLQFTLNLCEPKNASIGAQTTAAFTILEEREKPDTYLKIQDSKVNPNSEEAYIVINRSGNMGTTGTFTVNTKSATAKTGQAYVAQQMALTFTPGMREIKVPVTMLDNAKNGTYFEAELSDITVANSKNQTAKISITNDVKQEKKHQTALTASNADIAQTSSIVKKTNTRGVQIVDVSGFKVEHETDRGCGSPDGSWYKSDQDMVIEYDNTWSSRHNAVSVRSPEKINFTGVKQIVMHQKNLTGSVDADDGMFYVRDSDLFNNNTSDFDFADNIDSKYGTRWNMVNISSTYNRTANLDPETVKGNHYLYIAVHRTGLVNLAGFTVYNRGINDVEKNVRLMMQDYEISVIAPEKQEMYIGGSLQSTDIVTNVELVNPAATSDADSNLGNKFKIYRDETTMLSYKIDSKYNNLVRLKGVYFCESGNTSEHSELYTMSSDSLTLTPDILEKYSKYINNYDDNDKSNDNKIVIQPVFDVSDISEFKVENYTNDATSQRFDASTGNYYVGDKLIGNIVWTAGRDGGKYKISDQINFTFNKNPEIKENWDFKLDYRYASTKDLLQKADIHSIKASTNQISLTLSDLYVSVTPVLTLSNANTMLKVKNPDMGDFIGKDSKYSSTQDDGSIVITGYSDGNDDVNFNEMTVGQIISFSATPSNGLRAKWTYTNSVEQKTQTYYGSTFFYMIQNPYMDSDNIVTLEFVKEASDVREINISGVAMLQDGSIINPPTSDTTTYKPIYGALVMFEGLNGMSTPDGSFTLLLNPEKTDSEPAKIRVSSDEIHRAMTYYNNQYYLTDIDMSKYLTDSTGINVDLKLDYRTTGVTPISIDCTSSDGTTYHDSIMLTSSVAVQFNLKLNTTGQDPKRPVNMVRWSIENEDGQKSFYDIDMEENTNISHWANTLSEIMKQGDQLYVEPMWKHKIDGSDEYEYHSYGKWNTGYNFVASAHYETVTYAPDIGAPVTMVQPNPVLGPVSPLFSIKGFTPIINAGTIGTDSEGREIHTITIGCSFGETADKAAENTDFKNSTPLDKAMAMADVLEKYDEAINNGENPAFAGGKKLVDTLHMKTAVKLSFSFLLAYQGNYYIDDKTGEWEFVGNLLVAGAGGSIRVSMPFVLCYIPCFAYFTASINVNMYLGIFGMTDEETGKTVALTLDQLSDAGASTFQGVYQLTVKLGVGVGLGFDSLLSASGGVDFKFDIEFNDFLEGYGKFDMTGTIALELLFLKASWSGNIVSEEMFNTLGDHNEINLASLQSKIEADVMENITLGDMSVVSADAPDRLNAPLVKGHEEKVIEYTTTNVDPEIIPIGDGKFLIVTIATDDDGTDNILHYYIYDEPSDTIIESNNVIKKAILSTPSSTSDEASTGAINLNAGYHKIDSQVSATDYGDDVLIVWNKCLADREDTNDELLASVCISSIFYNKESGQFHDYQTISDPSGKNIYISPKAVYNEKTDTLQMFYQMMNIEDITLDTTLKEIQDKPTALMTSVYTDNNWSKGEVISANGSYVKYFDAISHNDEILLSYVASDDSGFVIERADGVEIEEEYENLFAETPNALYLKSFSNDNGTIKSSKPMQISKDDTINANPEFVPVSVENVNDTMLFFKSDGYYAYLSISDILDYADFEEVNGELKIDEVHAKPQYISDEDDYCVNDDMEIISNENGDIYALWTTREGNCQQIWAKQFVFTGIETINEYPVSNGSSYVMKTLETPRYALNGHWGGKTYLTEDDVASKLGYYKDDFAAVVLPTGNILTVYNAHDIEITEEGSHNINNLFVLGEYDTSSDYIESQSEDPICFSNQYPNAGETIKVTVRASNKGIKSGRNVDITLYANSDEVETKTEPLWLSTENKTIDFFYTIPENCNVDELSFSFSVTENGEQKLKSKSFALSENHKLDLNVKSISPMGVYTDENDKVSFLVRAIVKNNGNTDYNGGDFVKLVFFDTEEMCKAMKDDYKAERPVYTAFGREKIEPIKIGDEREVIFISEMIPESIFDLDTTDSANLHCIIESKDAENWKTRNADEEMSVISQFYCGLTKKPLGAEVESIKSADLTVSKGEQKKLTLTVTPISARTTSTVKYSSSNEDVATVNEAGVVTAINCGEAVITAQIGSKKTTSTVKVTGSAYLGDANCDGEVSILDATYIQMFYAKLIEFNEINTILSDVDKNGKVDIIDVTYIERYLVSLPETAYVGEKIDIK